MIEGLLASAILAVAAAAMLFPFTVGAQNNSIVVDQAAAVNLAEALMEEILSKPFYDPQGASSPGPESGETNRSLFDNIDDYDNYSESAGAMVDSSGEAISDASLSTYGRSVDVSYTYVPGQDTGEDPTFATVTVTVTSGEKTVHTLTRLVSQRGEGTE
jgi:hypothetical protein